MEDWEKQNIKIKFGLSIQNILDRNKAILLENERNGLADSGLIKSYGRLATLSGIPKPSIIRIVGGKINMASSTLGAIIEAL